MTCSNARPEFSRLLVRDTVQTTVPLAYLENLEHHLRRQGLEPLIALPELAQARQRHANARCPAETYCRLLLRAAELLNDPLLGLHLGQSMTPGMLGALGYTLSSSSTLGEALANLQRYQRLVNDVTPMAHQIAGDTLELRWDLKRGRMGALYDESGLVTFIEFARRLSGLHLAPRAVFFVNPPPIDATPYEAYFGCAVHWGQAENGLNISLKNLQLPILQPDRTLQKLLEPQLAQAMATLVDPTMTLEQAVQQAVVRLARHGVPELPQVANELHLSPRTFYRRLLAQGLNFRALRDRALQGLAEQLLSDHTLHVAEVGRQIGYTESSAFVRAFKRWTGQTPNAWRQQPPAS